MRRLSDRMTAELEWSPQLSDGMRALLQREGRPAGFRLTSNLKESNERAPL